MKENKKDNITKNKVQAGAAVKKHLPIKNTLSDDVKNTASQSPGLNQAKITRDDLLPSDGDNLTN